MHPKVRSISINGRKTSVSVEDEFWSALREIAVSRGTTIAGVIADIDRSRSGSSLSAAIRISVLQHFRKRTHSGGLRQAA